MGFLFLLWILLSKDPLAAHLPHAADLKPVGGSCSLWTSVWLWGFEGAVILCVCYRQTQDFWSVVSEG